MQNQIYDHAVQKMLEGIRQGQVHTIQAHSQLLESIAALSVSSHPADAGTRSAEGLAATGSAEQTAGNAAEAARCADGAVQPAAVPDRPSPSDGVSAASGSAAAMSAPQGSFSTCCLHMPCGQILHAPS